jgi:hypothetical protein
VYKCDDGYSLLSEEQDRLYCGAGQWEGTRPKCLNPQQLKEAIVITNSVSGLYYYPAFIRNVHPKLIDYWFVLWAWVSFTQEE